MASDAVTIEDVLKDALAPFGAPAAGLSRQMERVAEQLSVLDVAMASPVAEGATAKGSTERAVSIGGVLTGIGVGLGLPAMVKSVARLFGGGDEPKELPPLVDFALPASLGVNAGVSDRVPGGPFLVDYAQGGAPRPGTSIMQPTNITVHVQAMDSRSFMDHSGDIARAVRQAMLESSVLSDVIREA